MTFQQKVDLVQNHTYEELIAGSSNGVKWSSYLLDVYEEYFNKGCSSCPSKWLGYYNAIISKNMDTMCEYKLKEGVLLNSPIDGKPFSNGNITDKIAEAFIVSGGEAQIDARLTMFSKYPKDVKKRVSKKPAKKKESPKK